MINYISSFLWIITTIIIIICGIYLLFYLNFPQYNLSKKVKQTEKIDVKDQLKLLNLTLAGKIGVGSISGIALSLVIGGKGSIFWIWISSILITLFTYIEVILGIKYREKNKYGNIGGPQVYIKNILNKRWLSKIYSYLIVIAYLFSFILIQSNTIIISISDYFSISKFLTMMILLLFVLLSIKKGLGGINKVVSFLVPFMNIFYIILGIIVISKNIQSIPSILNSIVNDSFKIKSLTSIPIIIGIERSIFSNEAGMGTTSMVVALTKNIDIKNTIKTQILGTRLITFIITTISCLIVLTCDLDLSKISNINGIEIVNYAFNYHFGNLGLVFLNIIITLFAFSTIITSYYYGSLNIKYLKQNKNDTLAKIIVIIVIVLSIYTSSNIIWSFVDILTALTTLINIYAIVKLKNYIRKDIYDRK